MKYKIDHAATILTPKRFTAEPEVLNLLDTGILDLPFRNFQTNAKLALKVRNRQLTLKRNAMIWRALCHQNFCKHALIVGETL